MLTTDLDAIATDPEVDIVVELIGGLEPARSLVTSWQIDVEKDIPRLITNWLEVDR